MYSAKSAESKDVADSVSAKTIGPVDPAGKFADCIQSVDRFAVSVDNLILRIDNNAAHGMVDAHSRVTGPEGGLFQSWSDYAELCPIYRAWHQHLH